MTRWNVLAIFMALSISSWAGTTSIDPDGMLRTNGERCFILGLYEEATDDAFAEEVAKAGFNLIRVSANQESLDRAAKYNLQSWIPLSGLAVTDGDQGSRLKAVVDAWKSHPALSIWEAPDEALWNLWWVPSNRVREQWSQVDQAIQNFQGSEEEIAAVKHDQEMWSRYRGSARYALADDVEERIRKAIGMDPMPERLSDWHLQIDELYGQLKRGCAIVRDTDPQHVLWFNHAPRNTMDQLRQYGKLADIVGCDIYPVPFGPQVGHSDLAERNLASVGRFTERMAASVPGKPVWMVLQGFGWDGLGEGMSETKRSDPTYAQSRFMAYDAVVNGARGILYWGTFTVKKDSSLWAELKQVVSELQSIEPFLAAPDANDKITVSLHPTASSDEKGIRWLAKEIDGRWAIILVNESDAGLAFDIGGLDACNGKTFTVLNGNESLQVEEGKITFGLRSQSVEVLVLK